MANPRFRLLLNLTGFFALALALGGCDASVEDLRPASDGGAADSSQRVDLGADQQVELGVDQRVANQGPPPDTGPLPDGFVAPDTGAPDTLAPDSAPSPDTGSPAGTVASGSFSGLSGYTVSGTATVEKLANGSYRLDFAASFSASSGPGLVVVMTDQQSLGTINTGAGDVDLGALKSQQGAQSYPLTAAAAQRNYVHIYCKPFGVDFGRAELTPTP